MSRAERIVPDESPTQPLRDIFDRLYAAYGPQHWWPGDTRAEIVIGAILTQNTAWSNVERAIERLKRADRLSFTAIRDLPPAELEALIHPAGTYRVKAKRLAAFVEVLFRDHHGSIDHMLGGELEEARRRLGAIHGLGPETTDAILLYAGNRPTFVVDAYTKRVLRRHFLTTTETDYASVQALFEAELPPTPELFNEYHALLVQVGKSHCRTRARCDGCPLETLPHDAGR